MTDKKPDKDKEGGKATSKQEGEKKAAKPESKPKQEKEKVRQLIEEKMEKIRQQELVKTTKEKEGGEAAFQPKMEAAEEKAELKKEGDKSPSKERSAAGEKSKVKEVKAKPLPTSVFVTGKRKRAIARAFLKPGKGSVKVNSVPIDLVMPDMYRLKMMEPLMLMGEHWKKFDISVNVRGGGPAGQADAVRQVIARSLSEVLGPEARKTFLSYDRNLIVYDPRRTETHKPPHSSWGARRYKQRSKR